MAETVTETPDHVSLEDIRKKVTEIEGDVLGFGEKAGAVSKPVIVGLGVLLLVLVYLFGKKRGRKKSAVIEIARIPG